MCFLIIYPHSDALKKGSGCSVSMSMPVQESNIGKLLRCRRQEGRRQSPQKRLAGMLNAG